MPKISIIVPIYNMEKYLDRSISSLINQSLSDIEIILVNDGSKDNSLGICNDYSKQDRRIKILDKPNGGVSSARNEGIKVATGEYIGFIDPDDWIDENMYEKLYAKIIEAESEVAMCNFVIEDSNTIEEIYIPTDKQDFNKQAIQEWLIPNMVGPKHLDSNTNTIMGSSCRLLIKSQVITKNEIYFPLNIPLMEDLLWAIEIFASVNKVTIDTGTYYHYMKNDNSAVTGYRSDLNRVQSIIFNELEKILLKYNLSDYCKEHLRFRYINMVLGNIMNEVHKDSPKKEIEKLKSIKKYSNCEYVKEILGEVNTKQYTLKKRLTLFALKRGWVSYLYIYYKILSKIIG